MRFVRSSHANSHPLPAASVRWSRYAAAPPASSDSDRIRFFWSPRADRGLRGGRAAAAVPARGVSPRRIRAPEVEASGLLGNRRRRCRCDRLGLRRHPVGGRLGDPAPLGIAGVAAVAAAVEAGAQLVDLAEFIEHSWGIYPAGSSTTSSSASTPPSPPCSRRARTIRTSRSSGWRTATWSTGFSLSHLEEIARWVVGFAGAARAVEPAIVERIADTAAAPTRRTPAATRPG